MRLLIKNGYVLDPANGREGEYDIFSTDGRIFMVDKNIDPEAVSAERVIDANGMYVMPGFIDLHVHFRTPGQEYKENIETGSAAAAHGGFTTVCTMPNTIPSMDSPERVAEYVARCKKESCVNVLPIGAITVGQEGKELTDIEGMLKAGAVGISEDGKSVMDAGLCFKAFEKAKELDTIVFAHCEDKSLVMGGVMNAGDRADELGLPGIRNVAEDVICARDILIAKETGAKLHLCHVSTSDSIEMIKKAKEEGIKLTAETCPHYISMTDAEIPEDHGYYKMNPPLRSEKDKEKLSKALAEGILDVVSTDHAPHSEEEKNQSMLKAPFGITGLETAFPLIMTEMVNKGILTPLEMAERMSAKPAKILGLKKGAFTTSYDADIVIADPDAVYEINPQTFKSKGKNTPFGGKRVTGRVLFTIVGSEIVYEYEK